MRPTPLIAVPLADKVSPSSIHRAKKLGMDIAELRIDLFSSYKKDHLLIEIKKFKGIPVIATIRSKKEGGRWSGSEKERLELFKTVLPHAAYVDIERSSKLILKEVVREAKKLKKTVIISYHDFSKTPEMNFLKKILKSAKSAGADIVKIAVTAKSLQDVRRLGEFTASHATQKLITLSMGKTGALSRLLFPSLGSLVTFASHGRSTAPGQWDLKMTSAYFKKLYSMV